MKKAIPTWQMVGFVFTGILGTLLHFVFDWTGGSPVVALFSAVNESIWEHTKLLFYPMLLFGVAEYVAWGRKEVPFWRVKLTGILFGLGLIPVLYYTYTGVLGRSADWFNITIFFIAAGATYYLETKLFQKQRHGCPASWVPVTMITVLILIYCVLTFIPPRIPLFQDPVNGTYGWQVDERAEIP